MFEKIEKLQVVILGILLVLGILIATKTVVNSLSKDVVSVTGAANEVVTSDSGTIHINILAKKPTKQLAYVAIKNQLPTVIDYLKSKGLEDIEIKETQGYYSYVYNQKTGVNTNAIDSYNITQPIIVRSDDVQKIKDISLDIQNLIEKNIDIEVNSTDYFYSKLSELKVKLLEEATNDAKNRASAMLKSTGNSVGKIQSVRMGVFQITTVDSTNVSDMGINDTSSIEKRVNAVANVTFRIK